VLLRLAYLGVTNVFVLLRLSGARSAKRVHQDQLDLVP
jgi:hypothetical protein